MPPIQSACACAHADDAPEQVALQRLFARAPLEPAMFAPEFLAKIPISGVQSFVDSYKTRIGAPWAIAKDGFDWALTSPNGREDRLSGVCGVNSAAIHYFLIIFAHRCDHAQPVPVEFFIQT